MLFHTMFPPRAGYTHDEQKKVLDMWMNWKLPTGLEIKSFYLGPNAEGYLISEAETAEAKFEATSTWSGVYLDYSIVTVIEVEKGVPILQKTIAFRDSV